jgi:hypothetical protein
MNIFVLFLYSKNVESILASSSHVAHMLDVGWHSANDSEDSDDCPPRTLGDVTPPAPAYRHSAATPESEGWQSGPELPSPSERIRHHVVAHSSSANSLDLALAPSYAPDITNAFYHEGLINWAPDERCIAKHFLDVACERAEGANFDTNTDYGTAMQYIFQHRLNTSTPVLRGASWSAEVHAAGFHPDAAGSHRNNVAFYKKRYVECAEMLYISCRIMMSSLLADYAKKNSQGLFKGHLLLRLGASDSASFKLRINVVAAARAASSVPMLEAPADEPAPPLQAAPPTSTAAPPVRSVPSVAVLAKVMQSEVRVTMLVENLATNKLICITGPLPAPLQNSDRNTSEVAHRIQADLYDIPGVKEAEPFFTQSVTQHTQDCCNSNLKQINAMQAEVDAHNKDESHDCVKSILPLGCGIHRGATINTKSFEFTSFDISGMLAYAIAEQEPGRLQDLRRIIGDLLVAKLRILRPYFE